MPRSDLLRAAVAATALFLLAAMASVASGSGRAAPDPPASILIRGDIQIGRFRVQRDGTLDGAIRAFGPPTSLRRGRYGDCTVRWRAIGLRIGFYNLGGQNPCRRQYGYFGVATMVGHHWVTARGLRLSDPSRKLYVLYSPRRLGAALDALFANWPGCLLPGSSGEDPRRLGHSLPDPVSSRGRLADKLGGGSSVPVEDGKETEWLCRSSSSSRTGHSLIRRR
jgi:hypothetical protein